MNRSSTNRRTFLLTALGVGAASLLTACWSSAAPAPTSAPAAKPTSPPAPTTPPKTAPAVETPKPGTAAKPAENIKRGGVATIAFCCDPNHFDPHRGTTAQNYVSLVYDGLTQFKTGPDVPTGTHIIQPALAERWDISPDGRSYTFYLRKGVKFHDVAPISGRELTAADVEFSIQRMLARDAENIKRDLFEPIDKVEVVDNYTVKLTLAAPYSPLLANLGTVFGAIVPKSDVDFKKVAVGTGPFVLKEAERQAKYTYVKNPAYWEMGADGRPLPYLDGFVQVVVPEEATRTAALRAGQLDFTDQLVDNLAKQVMQTNPNLIDKKWPGNFSVMMRTNATAKPLDDVRVRQALSLAMDRQAIANALGGGEGIVNGPIPTALTDWVVPPSELPNFKPDLAKAKQLMADAGHANGFQVAVILQRSPANRTTISEAIQQQWKSLNVDLQLQFVESAELAKRRVEGNFELLADNLTPSPEPDTYTYIEYHSKSGGNVGRYRNAELDTLLEKQRATTSAADRKQVLKDVQIKLAEQQFILTTGDPYYHSILQPYVHGFNFSYVNQRIPIKHVWLEK